jgi:hypothetical protein
MAGHGHSPLKALLAPVVAAFDALLGKMGGDVGRCLLVAARGCLPAFLCGVKHDCLIAGVVLRDDRAWVLECASKEVTMSALPRCLHAMFRQCACATLASLAVNL